MVRQTVKNALKFRDSHSGPPNSPVALAIASLKMFGGRGGGVLMKVFLFARLKLPADNNQASGEI